MSSDSISDDIDEVESNIPTVPSKSFESRCAEYNLMLVPIGSSFSESPEFLVKI